MTATAKVGARYGVFHFPSASGDIPSLTSPLPGDVHYTPSPMTFLPNGAMSFTMPMTPEVMAATRGTPSAASASASSGGHGHVVHAFGETTQGGSGPSNVRVATVMSGTPGAMAGLYASTARLHGLASSTLAMVPEGVATGSGTALGQGGAAGRRASHTSGHSGGVSDGECESEAELGSEDEGSSSDEEQQHHHQVLGGGERVTSGNSSPISPSLTPREGLPHVSTSTSAGGLGMGRRVHSLGSLHSAHPLSAPGAPLTGDDSTRLRPTLPPTRAFSMTALSCSLEAGLGVGSPSAQGASAMMSVGLTQYFDRIAEGNEEDVPEF